MSKKIELVICLGSSCFARGNKSLVRKIDEYLKVNRLKDKVYYHGGHCFGKCENGPVLKIDDEFFEKVDENNVFKILDSFFDC